MKKCFISKNYRHIGSAGDKAKTDIEAIMLDKGYRNIGLRQNRSKNAFKAYVHTLFSELRGICRLDKGDLLVVQYPLKKYYDFVVDKAIKRGVHVITVIHDLGSFRRRKLTVAEEISRLNKSTVVIVHSRAMHDWLREHGLTTKMVILGLFDYISDSNPDKRSPVAGRQPRLMFAGDCSPRSNGWIYRLAESEPGVDLILYGGGVPGDKALDNIQAMGYISSDTLIAEAEGDYGVVWYGDSLDEGAGPLGEYLRYNAPHKTSLYLRAGIPVIIWDKAALADIVKRLDVGICVPSLHGISQTLAAITPERYAEMRSNALKIADKLAAGDFISDALDRAEQLLN